MSPLTDKAFIQRIGVRLISYSFATAFLSARCVAGHASFLHCFWTVPHNRYLYSNYVFKYSFVKTATDLTWNQRGTAGRSTATCDTHRLCLSSLTATAVQGNSMLSLRLSWLLLEPSNRTTQLSRYNSCNCARMLVYGISLLFLDDRYVLGYVHPQFNPYDSMNVR